MNIDREALWRDLLLTAEEFRKIAPWTWLGDTTVIGVRHPTGDDIGWCVVIGSMGQHLGFVMFPGDYGWKTLRDLQLGIPTPEDASLDQYSRSLTFVDHGHLSHPMRTLLKDLRWKAPSRNAWPDAIDFNSGYIPDLLTDEDIPWMIRALRKVGEAALEEQGHPGYLDPDRNGRLLLADHLSHHDSWERVAPPVYHRDVSKPFPFDASFVTRIATNAVRVPGDWLVDLVRPFPLVVRDRGSRPFYQPLLLMMDVSSKHVLASHPLEEVTRDFFHELLARTDAHLPKRFLVWRHDLKVQLQPLATALGVELDFRLEYRSLTDATIARLREGMLATDRVKEKHHG